MLPNIIKACLGFVPQPNLQLSLTEPYCYIEIIMSQGLTQAIACGKVRSL
ncbi:hypothetical protein [Nostoc sp. JL33]|nr:hypothetical protein [Nostoc sp. JL33]MBN3873452.1 hypothetical protein [Nostoc sp. JL33]